MALPEGLKDRINYYRGRLSEVAFHALKPKSYRGRISWGPSGHFPPGTMDRNDFSVYDPINQDPFFFACIQTRNDFLSQVPLVIYQDSEPVKPTDSDYKLWHKPNSMMYLSHLMDAVSVHQRVTGASFMVLDWGQGFNKPMPGPPREVWPFSSNHFRPRKAAGKIAAWDFRHPETAEEIPLLPEQYIRLWQYNWRHPMGDKGQTVLDPVAQSIAVNHAATVYEYEYIRHYGVPLATIETDEKLSPTTIDQNRERWEKYHDGPRTLKHIAFLTGGATLKQHASTLKDLRPETLHHAALEATSAVCGVPPALLGVFRYANYANSEAQIKIFLRRAVTSDCSRFADALNADYFPRFSPRKHCEFDMSVFPEMKLSKMERIQMAKELLPMGVPWREVENICQIGIDLTALGSLADTSFLGMSLLPVGSAEKIVKLLQAQGLGAVFQNDSVNVRPISPVGQKADLQPGREGLAAAARKALPARPPLEARNKRTSAEAKKRSAEMLRKLRPLEDEAAEKTKTWYWKQRQQLLKGLFEKYDDIAGKIPESAREKYRARAEIAEMSRTAGVEVSLELKGISAEAEAALEDILPAAYISSETVALVAVLSPVIKKALEIGGSVTFQEIAELGIDLTTEVYSAEHTAAVKFLQDREKVITERVEEYFKEVHGGLMEGFLKGETPDEVADRIRHASNIGQVRAQTMSRTEIIGAGNNGRMDSMTEAGVQYKGWAHGAGVKEPRPTHEAADGEVVKADEAFETPGETVRGGIRWPHDWQRAGAGEWCNCTCTLYTPTYDPRTGREFTLEELFGEKKADEYRQKFGENIKLPSRFHSEQLVSAEG